MQSPEHAQAEVAARTASDPFGAAFQQRAQAIIELYPEKRSALMPLLYEAMRAEGYLSEDGMREVARLLGLTAAQVSSVASFYTMYKRQPQGRYLISVCTSLPCMLLGADEILDAVERATGVPEGAIDSDGIFSVEHAECLGSCGGAPMLQVDYEFVEGLTPERVTAMCEYLRVEKPSRVDPFILQSRFGGRPSFDWGPADEGGEGSTGPHPGFVPTAPPAERSRG